MGLPRFCQVFYFFILLDRIVHHHMQLRLSRVREIWQLIKKKKKKALTEKNEKEQIRKIKTV